MTIRILQGLNEIWKNVRLYIIVSPCLRIIAPFVCSLCGAVQSLFIKAKGCAVNNAELFVKRWTLHLVFIHYYLLPCICRWQVKNKSIVFDKRKQISSSIRASHHRTKPATGHPNIHKLTFIVKCWFTMNAR